jgi:hypothetical protein
MDTSTLFFVIAFVAFATNILLGVTGRETSSTLRAIGWSFAVALWIVILS